MDSLHRQDQRQLHMSQQQQQQQQLPQSPQKAHQSPQASRAGGLPHAQHPRPAWPKAPRPAADVIDLTADRRSRSPEKSNVPQRAGYHAATPNRMTGAGLSSGPTPFRPGRPPPSQGWHLPAKNKHAAPSRVRMIDIHSLSSSGSGQGPPSSSTLAGAGTAIDPQQGRLKSPAPFQKTSFNTPRATKVHDAFAADSDDEEPVEARTRSITDLTYSPQKSAASSWDATAVVDVSDDDEDAQGTQLMSSAFHNTLTASERELQLQEMLSSMVLPQEIGDVDMEAASRVGGLRCQLLPHQVAGYLWLRERESGKYKGGILADDMGLGKTIQMLALIVGNAPSREGCTVDLVKPDPSQSKGKKKAGELIDDQPNSERITIKSNTSLIIAPLAVIRQWEREINEKTSPKLNVLVHHGPQRSKTSAVFAKFDVVVTTYTTAVSELNNIQGSGKNAAKERTSNSTGQGHHSPDSDVAASENKHISSDSDANESRKKKEGFSKHAQKNASPLFDCDWLRVVLDEAQNIKNHKTQMSIAAATLSRRALSKWCLSGTPIQNDALELYSLVRFLGIPPFDVYTHFKEKIADPLKSTNQNRVNWGMKRLCAVLSTIMLRRTKDATLDGRPILNLPERTIKIVQTDFHDEKERHFYDDLETQVKRNVEAAQDAGKKMNHMVSLLMLLRLRQACNHPLLLSCNVKVDAGAASGPAIPGVGEHKGHSSLAVAGDVNDDDDGLAELLSGLSVVHRRCDRCQVDLPAAEAKQGVQHCAECRDQLQREREEGGGQVWAGKASTKIRTMLSILDEVHRSGQGEKTIIFSQFTSFLDLVEPFLRQNRYAFVRYDGSLRPDERERALERIRSDASTRVILISFKAGNTGLNLTSCSRVILMDLWWNPMLEAQSIDRAHRLGQTRPVLVYKLVIRHSVEERILALQDKKRALAEAALEGSKLSKQNRLDRSELMYLFSGGEPVA